MEGKRTDETRANDEGASAATKTKSRGETTATADSTTAHDDDRGASTTARDDERGALLPRDQSERFTSRWDEIQTGFVEEPQQAVEEADALVADLMQRVTGSLTKERERLEGQWARGAEVSTEDLRVALTRYRSFFDRLLST